jgi:hypothetical protein
MKKTAGTGLAAFLILGAAGLFAQTEAKPPAFGISLSGFVKTDLIYDSRQTVSLREGHFFLYPKGESLDKNGADVNAASSFNMLSLQTRLIGKITGPDAFGAKTSGLIEGEFFGTSDGDTNGFRLRHGYVKLAWASTELMIGQFWHPMFVTESFPEVVSFDTGAPFQPFNRSPQVRLTQQFGAWSVAATALAQRDFVSNGPDGASSTYARNAALPEFNLKLQYYRKCEAGCETLFGIGGDYKRLRPRLSTALGYQTDAGVGDWAGMAFLKYKNSAVTIKAEAVYGQNLHHLTMMGGYAVREITNAVTGEAAYASLENLSLWGEILTNGTTFQTGLFIGYTKNYGAGRDIVGTAIYARGADIDAVYRISPRAVYNSGKVRLAGEIEYTAAAYGKTDVQGLVKDSKWIGNLRVLGAVYYFF